MRIQKTTIILFTFFLLLVIAVMLVPSNQGKDEINTIDELSGKTVGVQNATMYDEQVLEANPSAEIKIFSDINGMLISLLQRKIDAIAIEEITYTAMKFNNPEIKCLEEPLSQSQVAYGFSSTATGKKLHSQVEEYIAQYKADGTRDRLTDYWVKNYNPDTCRSDLSGITGENGVIKVAVEAGFEGFSNLVEGKPCGLDIDFIYGFCRKYGYTPDIVMMTFDGIAPALASGKCDMGAGIVINEERQDGILLSSEYFTNNIMIVIPGIAINEPFFTSIKNSINRTFIKENRWKMFLIGTGVTLILTLCSAVIGTLLGFGAYLLIKDGDRITEKLLSAISWVLHGLPTVVILMILYYVLFGSKLISNVVVAVIGFSFIFACSVFEMIANGVKAVGIGQYEASRAQGFNSTETFFKVILPQAAYHFMPNYKNEVVTLLKETSVVGYIAIMDLTKMADMVRSRTFDAFFPLISSALIYLLLIMMLSRLISMANPKIDVDKRKTPKDILEFVKKGNNNESTH